MTQSGRPVQADLRAHHALAHCGISVEAKKAALHNTCGRVQRFERYRARRERAERVPSVASTASITSSQRRRGTSTAFGSLPARLWWRADQPGGMIKPMIHLNPAAKLSQKPVPPLGPVTTILSAAGCGSETTSLSPAREISITWPLVQFSQPGTEMVRLS